MVSAAATGANTSTVVPSAVFQPSTPPSTAGSSILESPKSPAQVLARRYGLMTFDLSKILEMGVLSPGLVGVVWQLEPEGSMASIFVPQVGGAASVGRGGLGWEGWSQMGGVASGGRGSLEWEGCLCSGLLPAAGWPRAS